MHPDDLRKMYAKHEEKRDWTETFIKLRLNADIQEEKLGLLVKDSRLTMNKNKNRYRDVLPYDESRVRLVGEGEFDFINASLIPLPTANRRYIATQGPLSETAGDFWQMVWEQDSRLIVMLNRCYENSQEKCYQYFPVEEGFYVEYRQMRVTLDKEYAGKNFIRRYLNLTKIIDIRGCGYLDNTEVGPSVVHCSAGIGRSGTFIVVDSVLSMIAKAKESTKQITNKNGEQTDDSENGEKNGMRKDGQTVSMTHSMLNAATGVIKPGSSPITEKTGSDLSVLHGAGGTVGAVPNPVQDTMERSSLMEITDLALHCRRYRMGLIQTEEQLRFTWTTVLDALDDPKWAHLTGELEKNGLRGGEQENGNGLFVTGSTDKENKLCVGGGNGVELSPVPDLLDVTEEPTFNQHESNPEALSECGGAVVNCGISLHRKRTATNSKEGSADTACSTPTKRNPSQPSISNSPDEYEKMAADSDSQDSVFYQTPISSNRPSRICPPRIPSPRNGVSGFRKSLDEAEEEPGGGSVNTFCLSLATAEDDNPVQPENSSALAHLVESAAHPSEVTETANDADPLKVL